MAKITNTKIGVQYTNDVISANNPVALIACLNKEGIVVPTGTTEILLSNLLNEIFNNEKEKWVRIIKCVPYNPNVNNWTTNQSVIEDLNLNASSDPNSKLNIGDIFTQIGDFIGGTSTTGGGSSTTTSAVSGTTAAIVTLIIAAIIGVIIWKA